MCVQHSVDLITFQDQSKQIETLQREKELLSEDVTSLQGQIEYLRKSTADREVVTRLEAKIRDFEAKLDLAQTSHNRAEVFPVNDVGNTLHGAFQQPRWYPHLYCSDTYLF